MRSKICKSPWWREQASDRPAARRRRVLVLAVLLLALANVSATLFSQSGSLAAGSEDEGHLPKYLVGAYYFAGWWRDPVPAHYLNGDEDWRELYPERQPAIGWYDDRQKLVDAEIELAAEGGLDFFVFDYFIKTDQDPPKFPGANANNNNGLKFFLTSRNKSLMRFAVIYVNVAPHSIENNPTEWDFYTDKWVRLFQDHQYLKIDGKPVFFIIGAKNMEDQWGQENVQDVLQILRDKAASAGFPEILIGGGLPTPNRQNVPRFAAEGYDFFTAYSAAFELETPGEHQYEELLNLLPDTWNKFLTFSSPIPYAPVIVQGWDRRPLLKLGEAYYVNKTPRLFREQLRLARDFVDDNPSMRLPSRRGGQRMVVIYAWNEIGEGGELIPTKRERDVYLRQVGRVFGKFSGGEAASR